MIIFRKVSYKNFLSTGNVPNVVELDKHSTTLITAKNGCGKSTIVDALTYVLFGKPFRNVNKPQLINSINQKNLLVEIEFDVAGKSYLVRRGIKPNVFEIHCDGTLLNEEADTRDYQKILEQQILKLNYKTFTQVVILGSATFVPFMQLSANRRREVIEDILDIRIFSIMNSLLKEKSAKLKDALSDIEYKIGNIQTQIDSQSSLISLLVSSKENETNSILSRIAENNDYISNAQQIIERYRASNDLLENSKQKYAGISDAIKQADRMRVKFQTVIASRQDDIEFFANNDTCPKCTQNIDLVYKQNIVDSLHTNINTQQHKLDELNAVYQKLNAQLLKMEEINKEISSNNSSIAAQNHTISLLINTNKQLNKELDSAQKDKGDVSQEQTKLDNYKSTQIQLLNDKNNLYNSKQLHDIAFTLLKDTGIKTAIIHEYLPVINKLINMYLGALDFYAKFELDETFQEVIKSRNRDIFSYNSFSEGEKQKIDISILLSWRQIAKMKNSVNTNLLIMDEIFDSSLDTDSIDMLSNILKELTKNSNTNIFIISHRDISGFDMFDNTIRVEKRNEFSVIV